MELTPYVLLHLLSAAFLGGLGIYCWLNRSLPVTTSISQVIFLLTGLALDYAFDLASSSFPEKLFWMKGRFFFLAVVPVLWLVMIVRYIGQETLVNRRRLVALFVVPAITVLLAWTSDHHTLFRYNYRLDDTGLFPILPVGQRSLVLDPHLLFLWPVPGFADSAAPLAAQCPSVLSPPEPADHRWCIAAGDCRCGLPNGHPPSARLHHLHQPSFSRRPAHRLGSLPLRMINIVPIARSTVLEEMSDVMIILDRLDRVVDFNGAAQRVFGLQSAQSIGKPLELLLGRWPGLVRHSRKSQSMSAGVWIGEAAHRYFYDLSVTPVKDRRDEITGRIIIMRDMTDRQKAEVEHRRMEERLCRAEKMEALGALVGDVAHDLNNILSGIVSYPELILVELPSGSPLRDAISTIRLSGQRAAAVVQDLLILARKGVVSTEVLNLNDLVSDHLRTPEHQALRMQQPNVHFDLRQERDLPPIRGSRAHLFKALMNLVSYAAETTPDGGVVTITTSSAYLDSPIVGYNDVREGRYAVLTVSDTGKGIHAKDRGRIFEPFYTKNAMGRNGTGLGLTVVWGTVKDHNGYADVQTEEGRGTTFTLYFPVAWDALKKNRPPALPTEYKGTILAVDAARERSAST